MLNPTHLGLDTHKDTIAVAVLRADEAEPDRCTVPNTPEAIRKLVARLGAPSQLLACIESGPTGYDTYRILQDLGDRFRRSQDSPASWPVLHVAGRTLPCD